ncbi:oligosaccharide flippase family protein [Curtobacterium sp. MCPF17_046]|uniref:oligosaccharide flippase family protein n=1 Tax=Curtobacterium sp. MCPF17_046 TaxID=2175663 RepID=UPI000D825DBB|nr:oligosaccharide flippase family protein [Curtobacterium sp. MCPF17_046]PYY39098.1 hypothetical protein DEJ32_09150 [Curtobacterium sp. MCPF17_046]
MTTSTRTIEVDWQDGRGLAAAASVGGMTSAAASWVRFVIQMSSMVVIARTIGPDQYGSAATLLVAVTGAEVIRSGGVTWLIAHDTELSAAAASTLHSISRLAGAMIGALWCLVAALPLASALPGGGAGALAMAVVFLTAGSGAVPTAVLGRNLRFGAIGAAEVAAAVVSCTGAVALAAAGGGALALLLQATSYALTLRLAVALLCPWRPGPRLPLRALRRELAFAGNASLTQTLEWIARSLDRVFVALVFGQASAGFYVQASQLVLLPLEQVSGPMRRVAVPVLARLRSDPDRFRHTFTAILRLACGALWPVFAVLGVVSTPLIDLVFGHAWIGTVPVFLAMLPAAFALVVATVTVFLALADGAAGRQARWELWISRPLTVVAFLAFSTAGFQAMVLAVSAATVLVTVPGFLVIARSTPVRARDLCSAVWFPAVLALACAVTAAAARHVLPIGSRQLVLVVGAAAIVWCAGMTAMPTTRHLARRAIRRRLR